MERPIERELSPGDNIPDMGVPYGEAGVKGRLYESGVILDRGDDYVGRVLVDEQAVHPIPMAGRDVGQPAFFRGTELFQEFPLKRRLEVRDLCK